jgi:hypothetical protein
MGPRIMLSSCPLAEFGHSAKGWSYISISQALETVVLGVVDQ